MQNIFAKLKFKLHIQSFPRLSYRQRGNGTFMNSFSTQRLHQEMKQIFDMLKGCIILYNYYCTISCQVRISHHVLLSLISLPLVSMGSSRQQMVAPRLTSTYTPTAACMDCFIKTWEMQGVSMAPNLATPEQLPTPTDLKQLTVMSDMEQSRGT